MNSRAAYQRRLAAALLVAALCTFATLNAAQTPAPTPAPTPEMAASPTNPAALGIVPPSSLETPDSAFRKMDPGKKGYVTKEDTKLLPGFDVAFQRADVDNDSRLSPEEFNQAWAIYSGMTK